MNITLHTQQFGDLDLHLYDPDKDSREGTKGRIHGYVDIPDTTINGIVVGGSYYFESYKAGVPHELVRTPMRPSSCRVYRRDTGDEITENQRGKIFSDLEKALKQAIAEIPNFYTEVWEKARLEDLIAYKQQEINDEERKIEKLKERKGELEKQLAEMS